MGKGRNPRRESAKRQRVDDRIKRRMAALTPAQLEKIKQAVPPHKAPDPPPPPSSPDDCPPVP